LSLYFLSASSFAFAETGSLSIEYSVHMADLAWGEWAKDGAVAGTTGESRQMEAIKIKLTGAVEGSAEASCSVSYRAHVAELGWLQWVNDGEIAGTTGESRRLEALQIKLVNCGEWTVRYVAHVAGWGWLGLAKEGETAGTTGQSKRMEAIKIQVVPVAEARRVIHQNLDISIPVLLYHSFPLVSYYKVGFQFIGQDMEGTYRWKLADFAPANEKYYSLLQGYFDFHIAQVYTDLGVSIPSAFYQSEEFGTINITLSLSYEGLNEANELIWKLDDHFFVDNGYGY
jgi:uncharacterized protein YjdB